MPSSSMERATAGETWLSVIIVSTSSIPQIRAKPRRPNLLESASTTVFCAVRIILRLSSASRMSVVEMPKSRSMPSTPKKNLLNEQLSRILSAYSPTTERLLWRTTPPNCMMSMFSFWASNSVAACHLCADCGPKHGL